MTPWICCDVVFWVYFSFYNQTGVSINEMYGTFIQTWHVCIDICSGINPARRAGNHSWWSVPPLLIILGSFLLPLARSLFAQMDFQAVFPSPDESWRKTCFSFFREVFVYLKTWRIQTFFHLICIVVTFDLLKEKDVWLGVGIMLRLIGYMTYINFFPT